MCTGEHLKGNLAVLPLSLTQDSTMGKQVLPDHHLGGVSEGKCFANTLLFELGSSSDKKGDLNHSKISGSSCTKKH